MNENTFDGLSATSDTVPQEAISNSDIVLVSNEQQIKVYKIRWFILSVICIVNASNAINWICYSPIADLTAKYYHINFTQVNYLSLVYLIVTIPAAIAGFFIIEYFGLRFSVYIGSLLNFIGALLRIFSSVSPNGNYGVLMTGQVLCAMAQPFIMFITTKFANNWFAQDQRALANTLALCSNNIGILIGALVSPFISEIDANVKSLSSIFWLHFFTALFSFVPLALCLGIKRSKPFLPPSYSELQRTQTNQDVDKRFSLRQNAVIYKDQLKQLFTSLPFIYLLFAFGIALGVFNALSTLVEQVVCVRGYTNDDAGLFAGLMLLCGIVGAIVSGVILDKTKDFELLAKLCFTITAVTNILLVIFLEFNNDKDVLQAFTYISFCLLGLFGIPLLPICMEMSVECVYPVPESTATGILFLSGQVFGIIFILIYPVIGKQVRTGTYVYDQIQKCVNTNSTIIIDETLKVIDYSNPLYLQVALMWLVSILFIIFFKCPYLRLKNERS